MRILIMNTYGQAVIKETNILPRVGDTIDLFYKPLPKVTGVCLYPTVETLKELGITEVLDAIVTLG